jgi:LmbE family N-acetylglucosaminyl deacetylase
VMEIDGSERRPVNWPHWAISTTVDASEHWRTVWEAIRCHRSQLPGYEKLLGLSDEYHRSLWGQTCLHRLFSLVPAPAREDDIFAGLR